MTSSPVLGMTVNADKVVLPNDELIPTDALRATQPATSAVNAPPSDFSQYRCEDVRISGNTLEIRYSSRAISSVGV